MVSSYLLAQDPLSYARGRRARIVVAMRNERMGCSEDLVPSTRYIEPLRSLQTLAGRCLRSPVSQPMSRNLLSFFVSSSTLQVQVCLQSVSIPYQIAAPVAMYCWLAGSLASLVIDTLR